MIIGIKYANNFRNKNVLDSKLCDQVFNTSDVTIQCPVLHGFIVLTLNYTLQLIICLCVCVCVCVCVLVTQSCLTLCDPMDYSLPGCSTHEFSRQEYWSGLPFPSPEDLTNPGIEPGLPHCKQIFYHLNHQGSPITCFR